MTPNFSSIMPKYFAGIRRSVGRESVREWKEGKKSNKREERDGKGWKGMNKGGNRRHVHVESSSIALFVMVTTRPMLKAAVARPSRKIKSRASLVFRRIFTFQRSNAGTRAVTRSITHARTG